MFAPLSVIFHNILYEPKMRKNLVDIAGNTMKVENAFDKTMWTCVTIFPTIAVINQQRGFACLAGSYNFANKLWSR